ncbi:hypothetical protein IMG5_180200 [Ichthyophthirius multifiliis]|uniref:Uncharacterized protein n=1 Tax=Ichthyophthirius multifiliis TaxID=5932 RepID=G0R2P5_ICHMU|nr:hypothetical protein IMG5_180200 [Ichthyophthirius multifiliis]EGR28261.1 hypothetical protein IMG5_180200 [Ichthyophthirius multifiliis]|eukprot:XP_004027606.1 hypothetical protein IMG5_180200 [Ichthyophthirius multifiliis]
MQIFSYEFLSGVFLKKSTAFLNKLSYQKSQFLFLENFLSFFAGNYTQILSQTSKKNTLFNKCQLVSKIPLKKINIQTLNFIICFSFQERGYIGPALYHINDSKEYQVVELIPFIFKLLSYI